MRHFARAENGIAKAAFSTVIRAARSSASCASTRTMWRFSTAIPPGVAEAPIMTKTTCKSVSHYQSEAVVDEEAAAFPRYFLRKHVERPRPIDIRSENHALWDQPSERGS